MAAEILLSDSSKARIYKDLKAYQSDKASSAASGSNGEESSQKSSALDLRIIKMTPTPRSRLTRNILASGQVIYDSKVRDPIEITCDVVLQRRLPSYPKTLSSLREMYEKRDYKTSEDFSVIRTRDGMLYKNMALAECPHIEDSKHYDSFVFTLKFVEYVFADEVDYAASSSTDAASGATGVSGASGGTNANTSTDKAGG